MVGLPAVVIATTSKSPVLVAAPSVSVNDETVAPDVFAVEDSCTNEVAGVVLAGGIVPVGSAGWLQVAASVVTNVALEVQVLLLAVPCKTREPDPKVFVVLVTAAVNPPKAVIHVSDNPRVVADAIAHKASLARFCLNTTAYCASSQVRGTLAARPWSALVALESS